MSQKGKRIAIYIDLGPEAGGQFQYALSVVQGLAQHAKEFDVVCYSTRSEWQAICAQENIEYRAFMQISSSSDLVKDGANTESTPSFHRIILHRAALKFPVLAQYRKELSRRVVLRRATLKLSTLSLYHGKVSRRAVLRLASRVTAPNWMTKILEFCFKRDEISLVIFPFPTMLMAGLNVTSIGTIHDLMYKYERRFLATNGDADDAFYKMLYETIVRDSNIVLVDSPLGELQVLESFSDVRASIQVLPYCAPNYVTEYLEEKHRCPETLRASISEVVRGVALRSYVYYPAMYKRYKNHENLIKALEILGERGVQVNAVFTGTPGLSEQFIADTIASSSVSGQIAMLPYVSDKELCYLLEHAEALVMPTYAGPTNIPQLEAFALGCPVLTSNIYAMPWQIGEAGILFNPDDPEDIANAIEAVWLNEAKRAELIEKGYRRGQNFSFERFAKKLADIVEASAAS